MFTVELDSPEATALWGRHLARVLLAHPSVRTVLLRGDLGSGKTTLVRSMVAAFPGAEGAEVSSPSFTLCNEYPTQPPVLHCDLYRAAASLPEEVWEALDYIDTQPLVIIIEWAEYVPDGALPAEYLDIRFNICNQKRLVTVDCCGTASGYAAAQLQHDDWTKK